MFDGSARTGGPPFASPTRDETAPEVQPRRLERRLRALEPVMTSGSDGMRRDRELLTAHDGKLPPHVRDLAALIGFALVADFARVTDGTWLPQLWRSRCEPSPSGCWVASPFLFVSTNGG
jgi:hypothetical protein